jgi:NitT/TauT family transport system permease protein
MRKPFLQIRETVSRPMAWVWGLIPPLLLLGVWWLVTRPRSFDEQGQEVVESRLLSRMVLPSPRETAGAFHSLWFEWELSRSALFSLRRVLGGYLIAVVLALPLGILMGSFTRIKAMFNPLAVVGTYLPLPALGVLILAWSGYLSQLFRVEGSELYKYLYLAIVTFVVLLPQVVLAIENVDSIYLQTAYTQGAGRWHAVWKVLVPVALPDLYTALRMSFGVGWTYIILAEIYDPTRGLGCIIEIARRRGKLEHIYLGVLTIMLIGFALDKLWVLGGRWLFPYRVER